MNTIENLKLFNEDGPVFMGSSKGTRNCTIGIFGVPYDGTTSFKPGSRFGPSAIREVSSCLETFCPEINKDLVDIKFKDFGSLEIPHGAPEPVLSLVKKATEELLKLDLKPLIFGGEHSISSASISTIVKHHPDLILIQLDAHADLRETWLGSKHNHACSMRRCLEELPSKKLFQVGIRSGTKEEFRELYLSKRLIKLKPAETEHEFTKRLSTFIGRPIYISIDLDWFDPSIMPGTGTPEPGGFLWQDFSNLMQSLKQHRIVGADIVELAPQLDSSGISSILAAKVARTLLLIID